MDRLRKWIERARELVWRDRVEREVAEEMQFHVDMEVEERIRRGMKPAEARRTAYADFGGIERYREQARQGRWSRAIESVIRDLRYGARSLRRAPGFTLAVLVSLALGIGANTAVFSVVRSALLRPLPYGAGDRIVHVQQRWEGTPAGRISPAEYLDYVDRLEGFEAFGVYLYDAFELTGTDDPAMVRGGWLSPGALAAFGLMPARGRPFTEDDVRAGLPVTLISDRFWRDRLGHRDDVIGRTLTLNGREVEIIGVMPPDFRLPRYVLSGIQGHIYQPLGYTRDEIDTRGSHFLAGVGRLPEGGSLERAAAAVADVAAWMVVTYPDDYPADMGFAATVIPLADQIRGPVRTPILVLMVAVGLVLLVACGNVANLLVARTDARAGELALRSLLRAGRGRITSQAIVESLLLAGGGGLSGVAIAIVATDALTALAPVGLGWLSDVAVDGEILMFSLTLAVATGLAFGLLPAIQVDPTRVRITLRDRAGMASGARRGMRLRAALIAAQLAVAVVLLTGAGLLTRSFSRLVAQDPGYRIDDVVTAYLALPRARYPGDEDIVGFYRELVPRVAAIPGVSAAGAVTNAPLATSLGDLNFRIDGRPIPEGAVSPRADWQAVTPGYFEALGIRPIRGRVITARDDAGSMGVVVINQTLASMHWPDDDPIGKRFELGGGAGPGMVTVIGVVPDVRHGDLAETGKAQMYLAHQQFRYWGGGSAVPWMTLMIASPLRPGDLMPQIAARVHELDPSLPVDNVRTMAEVRSGSLAVPRLLMALTGAFAMIALTLAAVGVYGLTSYAVGRRTREFGIRIALGARREQVTGMVLGQGVRLAGLGVLVGVLGALGTGQLLDSLLYEVSPMDPATLIAVPLLLGGVAIVACVVPARRATRVNPVASLRSE